MARRATAAQQSVELPAKNEKPPRSLAVAEKGIHTGQDFASMMSALMSDLIEGRVTPSVGNATCNAGGKLLKVVELQYKYGTRGKGAGEKTLVLALEKPGEPEDEK